MDCFGSLKSNDLKFVISESSFGDIREQDHGLVQIQK